jgi:hypothetical protein
MSNNPLIGQFPRTTLIEDGQEYSISTRDGQEPEEVGMTEKKN